MGVESGAGEEGEEVEVDMDEDVGEDAPNKPHQALAAAASS